MMSDSQVSPVKVVLISDSEADFQTLQACLARAGDNRFSLSRIGSENPVEVMTAPDADVVILGHILESEYLLRRASRIGLGAPVVVLLDRDDSSLLDSLRGAGASDHLVRGAFSDELLYRVLHYNAAFSMRLPDSTDSAVEPQAVSASPTTTAKLARPRGALRRGPGDGQSVSGTPTQHAPVLRSRSDQPRSRALSLQLPQEVPLTAVLIIILAVLLAVIAGLTTLVLVRSDSPSKVAVATPVPAPQALPAAGLDRRLEQADARLDRLEAGNAAILEQLATVSERLVPADEAAQEPVAAPIERVDESQLSPVRVTAGPLPLPGDWFVNLGTFSSHLRAQTWRDGLQPGQGQLVLSEIERGGRSLYRVRLVGLPDRATASRLAREFETAHGLQGLWVGRDD
jgi:hypothetical protein